MPRNNSLKICVNTIMLFSFLALAGHVTINFWERYTIQNQLVVMKTNLHTLKETITHIEKTYDDLHTEITDLSNKLEEKLSGASSMDYCNKHMLEASQREQIKLKRLPQNAVKITRFPIDSLDAKEVNTDEIFCKKANKYYVPL